MVSGWTLIELDAKWSPEEDEDVQRTSGVDCGGGCRCASGWGGGGRRKCLCLAGLEDVTSGVVEAVFWLNDYGDE